MKKLKKKLSEVLNTFEIMENGVFAPMEQSSKCSIFHNIFKYIFQRRQKATVKMCRHSHYAANIINGHFD